MDGQGGHFPSNYCYTDIQAGRQFCQFYCMLIKPVISMTLMVFYEPDDMTNRHHDVPPQSILNFTSLSYVSLPFRKSFMNHHTSWSIHIHWAAQELINIQSQVSQLGLVQLEVGSAEPAPTHTHTKFQNRTATATIPKRPVKPIKTHQS